MAIYNRTPSELDRSQILWTILTLYLQDQDSRYANAVFALLREFKTGLRSPSSINLENYMPADPETALPRQEDIERLKNELLQEIETWLNIGSQDVVYQKQINCILNCKSSALNLFLLSANKGSGFNNICHF